MPRYNTLTDPHPLCSADANSAPVVMVSSVGGSAITLATGTAGGTTTFGGQVFRTAAPAVLAADSSSSGADASSTMSMSMSSSASTSTSTGKSNGAAPGGVRVSRSAAAGALAVLGSVALGAVAVL